MTQLDLWKLSGVSIELESRLQHVLILRMSGVRPVIRARYSTFLPSECLIRRPYYSAFLLQTRRLNSGGKLLFIRYLWIYSDASIGYYKGCSIFLHSECLARRPIVLSASGASPKQRVKTTVRPTFPNTRIGGTTSSEAAWTHLKNFWETLTHSNHETELCDFERLGWQENEAAHRPKINNTHMPDPSRRSAARRRF